MKILVLTQYYWPEPGATTNRLTSFVEAMANRGHEVTVICEFPNHPSGKLDPKDKWRLYRKETKDNYTIIRTFVITFPKKNNIKRMLFYLSFAFSSLVAGIFTKKHDIVFSSSPPIFHVMSALLISIVKRSRFVIDIRDIWPDTALHFEAVTSTRLLRWGGAVERTLYKRAEMIFTISDGLAATINSRGGEGKVSVSYNGSGEDMLNWNGDSKKLRQTQNWDDKLIVLYAGLIGLGQNLIALPDQIKDIDNDDVRFVIIGDGPEKANLMNRAAALNVQNMIFMDLMSREDVIALTHAADITLVVLREADFFKSAIPSKFFDCMAAGKPVVSNVDGELRSIMEQNNTGIYFSFSSPESFSRGIRKLKDDPELREIMGRNGKKLVQERFLRSRVADLAVQKMEGLMNSR